MSEESGTKTVEMTEVNVIGTDGKQKKEYIPLGWNDAFKTEFGKGVPPLAMFLAWKDKMEARESENPNIAYRFEPKLKEELYEFLNNKPVSEVEHLIQGLFEVVQRDADGKVVLENGKPIPVPEEQVYYTAEGLQLLIDYLREKCPRTEGKPLIEKLANGGIIKFELRKAEQKKETDEKKD